MSSPADRLAAHAASSPPPRVQSDVPGIVWPALTQSGAASLRALMEQLEASQWFSPEQLAECQGRQLVALTRHASTHSASFRQRLTESGCDPASLVTPAWLAALPVLRRRQVREERHRLLCGSVPPAHLPAYETSSSGSTGEPVVVTRTAINQLFWLAFTLREHLWHRRDFSQTLAVIRARLPSARPVSQADWGAPVSLLFRSGPAHGLLASTDIREQLDWLLRITPQYLLTYPSNLAALLDECEARNVVLPGLRQIRTMGENLSPALRRRALDVLQAPIADTYSSQELGVLAVQCPASGLYHTMAEGYVVEVLDDQGRACRPGEIGRIVVTDLHNYATPLIRYDTGDFAQAAAPCHCGRGLPTLQRIVGRERNMVVVNGSRRWPLFGFDRFLEIAPITQYQLVQDRADSIELRLVCAEPPTAEQKQRLAALIRESLGHPFEIRFTLFPEHLPAGRSGKYEEFMCLVTP